jgi:diguanylate cyclase (GGDEF)-like protein
VSGGPEGGGGRPGPILDIRIRWRAGWVALGCAGLLAVAALARPLAPGSSPRLRLAVSVALGLGVAGSALLASLRGHGRAESYALYAFLALSLDGLGQLLGPLGWPAWPAFVVLLAGLAVAEPLPVALGVAALAAGLSVAEAAAAGFGPWRGAVAASAGYAAAVLAVDRALTGEKRRLSRTLAELARLRHGIEDLDPKHASPPLTPTGQALRQVSEQGRRALVSDRLAELDEALARIVRVARAAVRAHAVLYLELDRSRELAYVRAADGPGALRRDATVPLGQDPVAFVLDRKQAFYATDFRRLLWSLPYYEGEVRVGTLLAVPVRHGETVAGVLVADRLEVQGFTGEEPALVEAFAGMAADQVQRARTALGREEAGAESRAVYQLSQELAAAGDSTEVRRLLIRSAMDLVPLEAAAVVTLDAHETRYAVTEAVGWAKEFRGREVALDEKTWAAWVLRSASDPYLLDNVAGARERMPILVLDEGGGRAESLLAVPLATQKVKLGALILTGRRGAFDAVALRVLGVVANQAAAILLTIHQKERHRELAVRDGLTGLYNRRAFSELLAQGLAREDRQGGRFGLLLLDLDHFKKLNDGYGHPAGDAALKHAARLIERLLRRGDQAARYGGEEFAAILPGADQEGTLHMAERLREALASAPVVFEGARIAVTASFGAAVFPADAKDPDGLLAAADRALYAAKQAGRNRVVAASTLPAPTA